MRIKNLVLLAINGSKELKEKVRLALKPPEGVSLPTLYRALTENTDDLTKASVLKVIREELGLTDEEILEELPINEGEKYKQ